MLCLTPCIALAILAAMDTEIEYLESRVAELIARLQEWHQRNSELAATLVHALRENAELRAHLEETHTRVAALIKRLPAEEERG